ncbi:CO-methylating acetyl-CoA synthase corrinoid iron-sulfur protein large subunit precursor [Acetitomaculum ruminis DSM 5522]|uniref:CO-methylating acetyl-CoA synthase corrinoid iron-sulfur protein large subunit n=1 Tax=Acetitomaculum ruminis DSM 5522 TaxID=1120918 RepID=A0A1I1ANR2_9FIRM|nr:acetyl-CoA decarbonylase/synthase complex subunit gamma [Acetitomaculum ruminis]SFB39679.1 CO-methylating acetyl-CoA synthase corrinoid iron-sulfur protein large subunit precursor [Acetitomaculum ruminis DSM 5522]
MALKGLDIFKLTPKKNCKECGFPTCMAFSMKVAQGAVEITKCPHISDDVVAQLAEATAPPMKTIKIGAGDEEHQLGGETVLYRHEKTFVSKTLYATTVCDCKDDAENDAILERMKKIDYERIGEREYVELVYVNHADGKDGYVDLVKKADATGRTLVLGVKDVDLAKAALDVVKDKKPILNGADASNYEAMSNLATEYGVVLGVTGANLDELHDTVEAIEKLGNKNLILDVGTESVKDAFKNAVEIRRACLKNEDRTFGYPSLVNIGRLAAGDKTMQAALASLFTLKYGSVVVFEEMDYAQALALYGLRQNVFTDPQKPMTVEPGIYPINGATADSLCATTVDFALTYFVVSGELERSGVPINLIIQDAGGMSVLTSWAAGKLSASSISKFIEEEIKDKVTCRKLIIPGKVAVLKGELENKLPDWEIIVAPNEAVQLVKFLKDLTA